MIALRVFVSLALISFTTAVDHGLAEKDVIFLIDAADMNPTDRESIFAFAREGSADATKQGANVGIIYGTDTYITDEDEFDALPISERVTRVDRFFHMAYKFAQQHEIPDESTLADGLSMLDRRLSFMNENNKNVVVIMITEALEIDVPNLQKNHDNFIEKHDKVRFAAIVIGQNEQYADFIDITGSKCTVPYISSAEKLSANNANLVRMKVLLKHLANDPEITEDLCDIMDEEVLMAIENDLGDDESDHDQPDETVVEPELEENEPIFEETEEELPIQQKTVPEDGILEKLPQEDDERQAIIEKVGEKLNEELNERESSADTLSHHEEETIREMEPIRVKKVKEDKEMIKNHRIVEPEEQQQPEEKPKEKPKEKKVKTEKKPAKEVTVAVKEDIEPLVCYRCDGCTPSTPKSSEIMTCGEGGKYSCFTARIGFGKAATYVRGCEILKRCVEVDAPVLKRTCCNTTKCNGAVYSKQANKNLDIYKNIPTGPIKPKTTTTPTTTTAFPSIERAKLMSNLEITEGSYPLANVEMYFVVDFNGISDNQMEEILGVTKRMAVQAAMLGADVGVVNNNRIRRMSPYQIHIAFGQSPTKPSKEDVYQKFEKELHLEREVPRTKYRVHRYFTTTPAPNLTSSIPDTFKNMAHKMLHMPGHGLYDEHKDLFVIFLTGAELPTMSALTLWESHQKLTHLSPHYMALMVGERTVPESFVELNENSNNPRCMVMRFNTVNELKAAETELWHLIVDAIDYTKAFGSLVSFRCGQPEPPVVEPRPVAANYYHEEEQPAANIHHTESEHIAQNYYHEDEHVATGHHTKSEHNAPMYYPEDEHAASDPFATDYYHEEHVGSPHHIELHSGKKHHHEPVVEVSHPSSHETDIEVVASESEIPVVTFVDEAKQTEKGEARRNMEKVMIDEIGRNHKVVDVASSHEKKEEPITNAEEAEDHENERVVVIIDEPDKHQRVKIIAKPVEMKEEEEEIKRIKNSEKAAKHHHHTPVVAAEISEEESKEEDAEHMHHPKAQPNNTEIDAGKLMCYHCEECTAAAPAKTSVVACGDGDPRSPNRGVCFIQRVGEKFTRGCIEGYECLETNSDVLTNFCCNSQSLCNDVLPPSFMKTEQQNTAGAATVTSSISVFLACLILIFSFI